MSIGRAGAAGNPSQTGLGGLPNAGDSSELAGAAGAAGALGESCDLASVDDLEVALRSTNWDPLGYPPYAFDGCTLVYVASGNDPGALHVRNLATGEDTVLESAVSKPRRPAVAGSVIAWEADGALGSEVHVHAGGKVEVISGAFVRAEEPRATDDAVVFTGFSGPGPHDDSDVYLFDVVKGELSVVAAGAGQQRFADVSKTHVAFTDFSEDPKGYFDEMGSISDIALIERATGNRSNRPAPGKQAFPLLGADGVFAYLEWAAVHPEPKFGQFWLKVGYLDRPISEDFSVKTTGQVSTNPAYVRPSLHGLNLDFIDQGPDGAALYRASAQYPGDPCLVQDRGCNAVVRAGRGRSLHVARQPAERAERLVAGCCALSSGLLGDQHALFTDLENRDLFLAQPARLHPDAQLVRTRAARVVRVDVGVEMDRDHAPCAEQAEGVERLIRTFVRVLHEVTRGVRADR